MKKIKKLKLSACLRLYPCVWDGRVQCKSQSWRYMAHTAYVSLLIFLIINDSYKTFLAVNIWLLQCLMCTVVVFSAFGLAGDKLMHGVIVSDVTTYSRYHFSGTLTVGRTQNFIMWIGIVVFHRYGCVSWRKLLFFSYVPRKFLQNQYICIYPSVRVHL